jgi:hypothetical protein
MKKIALGLVALSALSTAAFAANDRSWDAFDIKNGTVSTEWTSGSSTENEGLKSGATESGSYFQAPGYTNDSK